MSHKRRHKKSRRPIRHRSRVNMLMKTSASAQFFIGRDWVTLRSAILGTYGKQCMKCLITTGTMQVDHIVPRSDRPDLALDFMNLQVLCKECNLEKSNKSSMDYRPKDRIPAAPYPLKPLSNDAYGQYKSFIAKKYYLANAKKPHYKAQTPKAKKFKKVVSSPDNRHRYKDNFSNASLKVAKGDFYSAVLCRIYKCDSKPINATPYCEAHTSKATICK